jgi:PPM family protein phosphatase
VPDLEQTTTTARTAVADHRRAADQGPVLQVSSYGISDPGRVRERNEDQFVIAELRRVLRIRQSSLPQPESLMGDRLGHLFVVADGMGGHRAGDYASALAVASVENIVLNTIGWLFSLQGEGVLAEFQEAVRATDRWVIEAAQRQPELKGMGTTLTMAYLSDGALYMAHAGDSRCYLYRGGRLERLTRDHTFVANLVSQGLLAPEDAASHRMRNIITNAVGGDERGVIPGSAQAARRPRRPDLAVQRWLDRDAARRGDRRPTAHRRGLTRGGLPVPGGSGQRRRWHGQHHGGGGPLRRQRHQPDLSAAGAPGLILTDLNSMHTL